MFFFFRFSHTIAWIMSGSDDVLDESSFHAVLPLIRSNQDYSTSNQDYPLYDLHGLLTAGPRQSNDHVGDTYSDSSFSNDFRLEKQALVIGVAVGQRARVGQTATVLWVENEKKDDFEIKRCSKSENVQNVKSWLSRLSNLECDSVMLTYWARLCVWWCWSDFVVQTKLFLWRWKTTMVQTSKTDHFFKLAPFWSPLTDLIDFGMAGKFLTLATRWCSPFVDSVSRIWIKPQKSLIGCLGSNGYNLWPISTVASTTNGRPQRPQLPFRAAVLGQFSLP